LSLTLRLFGSLLLIWLDATFNHFSADAPESSLRRTMYQYRFVGHWKKSGNARRRA
jgi:hypothetical protein